MMIKIWLIFLPYNGLSNNSDPARHLQQQLSDEADEDKVMEEKEEKEKKPRKCLEGSNGFFMIKTWLKIGVDHLQNEENLLQQWRNNRKCF